MYFNDPRGGRIRVYEFRKFTTARAAIIIPPERRCFGDRYLKAAAAAAAEADVVCDSLIDKRNQTRRFYPKTIGRIPRGITENIMLANLRKKDHAAVPNWWDSCFVYSENRYAFRNKL